MFADAVPPSRNGPVLAVISPHAGYVYSGQVAASAIGAVDPDRRYANVFLIGPSHRVAFEGAALFARGTFVTPLGKVRVNEETAARLLRESTLFMVRDDAHVFEHSLEVQLPFLQVHLTKEFRIVPVVLGTDRPETCRKIAEALRPYLTPENLFVVSSDFSHYPSYAAAVTVDRETGEAIVKNSPDALLRVLADHERRDVPNLATSACGSSGLLTLLYMSSNISGTSYEILQYKNSGDAAGDRDRVVGYFAIALRGQGARTRSEFKLTPDERSTLLGLARSTLQAHLGGGSPAALDAPTPPLKTPCGAFVTLRRDGELRGCIGRFDASEPLYRVVQQMAIAAATEDPRFPPVKAGELAGLEIEISVLTPMRRISSVDEFELGKHGIYMKSGNRSGTFLPQVAAETGWSREEFLGHCARDKAGLGWDGWKKAELYVYEALVFSEHARQ